MRKKSLKAALVATAAAAASLVLALPASAASFSLNVGDGTVTYSDGVNQFCLTAYNSEGARWVQAVVTPVSSSSAPSYTRRDNNNYYGHSGSTCWTINAPEDTRYRAVITSYWGERGTTVSRGTQTFYS
ncbi:hypothetical protein [Parafrankia sp. FMc2]|uniref:hypothetical protein n=1 Tax=Parafrankia sp. FMc2 TaxID=3233196 RepID=UPI0034D41399